MIRILLSGIFKAKLLQLHLLVVNSHFDLQFIIMTEFLTCSAQGIISQVIFFLLLTSSALCSSKTKLPFFFFFFYYTWWQILLWLLGVLMASWSRLFGLFFVNVGYILPFIVSITYNLIIHRNMLMKQFLFF